MPKKLGTSTKALEARERKAEKKRQDREAKDREIENEFWKDEDKHIQRKLNRKDERGEKRQEQLEKKKELRRLYESELEGAKSSKGSEKSSANKITQNQILLAQEAVAAQLASLKRKNQNEGEELEPNMNRIEVDGAEARTVDEAIAILKLGDTGSRDLERHPERRIKSAYTAYEEKMLPILREENPSLHLSQLKQLVFKNFQKAPENPKNQPHASYNT